MSSMRQAMLGMLTALFSAFIIFGSMLLALTEGGQLLALAVTPASTSTPLPPVDTPRPGEPTFTPSPSPLPSASPTPPPSAHCLMPPGWQTIDILPGDTLPGFASSSGVAIETLRAKNCLTSDTLWPGNYIYIPIPTPIPTATAVPTDTPAPSTDTPAPRRPTATAKPEVVCSGPPPSWIAYTVRRGDTLSAIGRMYGVSAVELQSANCLTSTIIHPGQILRVPNVAPRLPSPTFTPRPTRTVPPTPTTPPTNTPVPTDTPVPTNTPVPTDTPVPTNTPVPTDTPMPSTEPLPTDPSSTSFLPYTLTRETGTRSPILEAYAHV